MLTPGNHGNGDKSPTELGCHTFFTTSVQDVKIQSRGLQTGLQVFPRVQLELSRTHSVGVQDTTHTTLHQHEQSGKQQRQMQHS